MAGTIGVCYGTVANNLPPAKEVIELYKQYNIKKMRLYGPNHEALQALSGSNIEVMLGVENELIRKVASSQAVADDWIQRNVTNYGDVNFKYIAVGNEIKLEDPMAPYVGPAIEKIQAAISKVGLANKIKVSTAVYPVILQESYPPSRGAFKPKWRPFLDPIIGVLKANKSPLFLNMYPYFSYIYNRQHINPQYPLFTYPSVQAQDGHLKYRNLFDATLDAHYAALERVGGGSVKIVVSETGWSSAGGDIRVRSKENARIYNSNLIKHVKRGRGPPRKPEFPIEAYIFAILKRSLERRLRSILDSFSQTRVRCILSASTESGSFCVIII